MLTTRYLTRYIIGGPVRPLCVTNMRHAPARLHAYAHAADDTSSARYATGRAARWSDGPASHFCARLNGVLLWCTGYRRSPKAHACIRLVYLRGRWRCALIISHAGVHYLWDARIDKSTHTA